MSTGCKRRFAELDKLIARFERLATKYPRQFTNLIHRLQQRRAELADLIGRKACRK